MRALDDWQDEYLDEKELAKRLPFRLNTPAGGTRP